MGETRSYAMFLTIILVMMVVVVGCEWETTTTGLHVLPCFLGVFASLERGGPGVGVQVGTR